MRISVVWTGLVKTLAAAICGMPILATVSSTALIFAMRIFGMPICEIATSQEPLMCCLLSLLPLI